MRTSAFLCLFLLLFASTAFAVPDVTHVSGTLTHKGTLTITGTGFGTKSPAAPVFWDACDAASTNSMATYYQGSVLPNCADGNKGDANITTMKAHYDDAYPDLGGTPMPLPHSRVTKYIAGATSTCSGAWGASYDCANIVFTRTAWPARALYTMYWYRVAPTFHQENNTSYSSNMKEIAVNPPPNGAYLDGPPQQYIDWCNGDVPSDNDPADAKMRCEVPANTSGCSAYPLMVSNPMQGWLHTELVWDSTGYKWAFSNGAEVVESATLCSYKPFRSDYMTVSWGGFTRIPLTDPAGNYRYWTGIYADSTFSRVMLGNTPTWSTCTKREPQPPITWSSTSIEVEINLGSFTDDDPVFVFVFDSTNAENPVGEPVTTGGCSVPADCYDGNVCTDDVCTVTVCSNPNNTASCDADGLWCTTPDICAGGVCMAGAARDCADLDNCTTDTCNDTLDVCVHAYGGTTVHLDAGDLTMEETETTTGTAIIHCEETPGTTGCCESLDVEYTLGGTASGGGIDYTADLSSPVTME